MIEACLVFWKNNGVMRHPVDLLPHCCDCTQPSSSPQRGRGGARKGRSAAQGTSLSGCRDECWSGPTGLVLPLSVRVRMGELLTYVNPVWQIPRRHAQRFSCHAQQYR